MFVVQSQLRPAAVQNALHDLMRDGLSRVRVCSAYLSRMGSRLLLDAVKRNAPGGDLGSVDKTVVTSLDFGMTEPDALRMWQNVQADVRVAGAAALAHGTLMPEAAFHPKFYVFDKPDGRVASLVTSANLTRRGLTANSEVGWAVTEADVISTEAAWSAAIQLAEPLTEDILRRYEEVRERVGRVSAAAPPANERIDRDLLREPQGEDAVEGDVLDPVGEMAPVPRRPLPAAPLPPFPDVPDPDVPDPRYGQMWVQSFEMSGGSHTQLELPRGARWFFGEADPTLVAGNAEWSDRLLRWHGNNQMWRINLPSAANGGFDYAQCMILFRRLSTNSYELRVHPWDSDTARACLEASRQRRLLFRVGRTNTSRLAGFLE